MVPGFRVFRFSSGGGCSSHKMKRSQAPTELAKRSKATPRAKYRSKTFSVPRWAPVRTSTGFPKQLQLTHRYVEPYYVACTAGGMSQYKFRTNGLFDPNFTGTGHQPLYFDQVAAIYNHYTVIRSKITARISNLDGSAQALLACIYIEDDTSSTPSTFAECAEQSSAVSSMSGPSYAGGVLTLSKTWNAVTAFGPSPTANSTLHGTSGSDPTEQQIFQLNVQPNQVGTSTVNVAVLVTIEYTAIWDELKNLGGS